MTTTQTLRNTLGVLMGLVLVASGFTTDANTLRQPVADDIVARITHSNELAVITGRDISSLQTSLDTEPTNIGIAARLAEGYLLAGQRIGQSRFYGYARSALRPWLDGERIPIDLLWSRATIRQHHHDFEGALEDVDRLLAARPRQPQAWLTRASILENLGRPQGAAQSCLSLIRLNRSPSGQVCLASAMSLMGRHVEAYRLVSRVSLERMVPNEAVWAALTLAEITERKGAINEAKQVFHRAMSLTEFPGAVHRQYAEFLLRQRAFDDVVVLTDERPNGLRLQRLLAQTSLGTATPIDVSRVRQDLVHAGSRGSVRHLFDDARFALWIDKDPMQALKHAQANWRVQRTPADAQLLLECALARGKPSAAKPVLAWLEATGYSSPRLAELRARVTTELGER
ncbi:MAG: tetratricopeptide repeat protein [Pseudomonadota bacterium]